MHVYIYIYISICLTFSLRHGITPYSSATSLKCSSSSAVEGQVLMFFGTGLSFRGHLRTIHFTTVLRTNWFDQSFDEMALTQIDTMFCVHLSFKSSFWALRRLGFAALLCPRHTAGDTYQARSGALRWHWPQTSQSFSVKWRNIIYRDTLQH